ncbi:MAG: aldose 1-epimerase family protein [Chitinophagaceae bacterium]
MVTIENDILRVAVNPKGAELDSLFHKTNRLDYLWSGDPVWAKKSPVLFPIVGTLKDNSFFFNGRSYQLGRHGFARDRVFAVSEQSDTSVAFSLAADEVTYEQFPFDFRFSVNYSLKQNMLAVTYIIENYGEGEMFFSVGGHPAFKLPLIRGAAYGDYYLEFDSVENAGRWPISPDGLLETLPVPLMNNTRRLPLSKDLFYDDALVFKHLSSSRVLLKNDSTIHGLELDFTGFPYLGIWAAKDADFVCIEPWCGIADSVDSTRQLAEKEGIQVLGMGQSFERTWGVKIF